MVSRLARIGFTLALAAACSVGAAKVGPVAASPEDDPVDDLMGDLMFHADLMVALDTLCPTRAPARDWLSVIRTLPVAVRTPDLRDLSRRLSAQAAHSMVTASGGCATQHYAQVYAETRIEYESLLEQWARASI